MARDWEIVPDGLGFKVVEKFSDNRRLTVAKIDLHGWIKTYGLASIEQMNALIEKHNESRP